MVSVSTLQKTVVYGAVFTVTSCSFFYYKIQCKSIIWFFWDLGKYVCIMKFCPKCCSKHAVYWILGYLSHLLGNCRIIIWKFNKVGVRCLKLQRKTMLWCSMHNVISFFVRCFEKVLFDLISFQGITWYKCLLNVECFLFDVKTH